MSQCIELSIPPWGDFLFLTRTAVGAVAAHVGMTVEEIEDLYLAVDELCLSLIGPTEASLGQLHLRAEWREGVVDVRCRLEDPDHDGPTLGFPDEISKRLLDALVDAHGLSREGDFRVGWLTKRRTPTSGG